MATADSTVDLAPFKSAHDHLDAAVRTRDELLKAWNQLCDQGICEFEVLARPDGSGQIWAYATITEEATAGLEIKAQALLLSIKAAMDAAVLATAEIVCAAVCPVEPELHTMPLCRSPQEFDALVSKGCLPGLRPDQVRALQQLQPYAGDDDRQGVVGKAMAHLMEALSVVDDRGKLVGVWASSHGPELRLLDGAHVESLISRPDGLFLDSSPLTEFRVSPPAAGASVQARPNVALDLILNAQPWPTNPDDNLSARVRTLLIISEHLIAGLELSVSQPMLFQKLGHLDKLIPAEATSVWSPVVFDSPEQECDARTTLSSSDLNLASFRTDDGVHLLLRLEGNTVVARPVPEASPLQQDVDPGPEAERVSLSAAARLGLRDFVFRPKVVQKGSGTREIGDGTLISATRGIALQVKARTAVTSHADREANWLVKKAQEGLKQACGTIRTALSHPNLALMNLRGREISLRGDMIEWVPAVILDHPNPPNNVTPYIGAGGRGLVILRRDWEFLWNQLRSVAAVVDYAHRVADDRIALGTEAHRYFDLADKDVHAPPEALPDWMNHSTMVPLEQRGGPKLPREPVTASDAFGHAVFQKVLEDVAATEFECDEQTRLDVLALVDQVDVAHRAELGRTLLRRLDRCALAPANTLLAKHRIMFLNNGHLHLTFSVYSQLTEYHRRLFRSWVLCRRQQFLEESGQRGPEYPWTVGVLLTPRPDGPRPWDTTAFATDSGPAYSPAELDILVRAFDQPN